MFEPLIILSFIMGGLAHILSTMVEDSAKAGKRIKFMEVANRHPYQLPLSIVFSVMAYIFLFQAGQLNEVAAFAAGYMGDSVIKKFMAGKGK